MTRIRDDVRLHFERQAALHPAPGGLRYMVLATAHSTPAQPARHGWIAGAIAILVTTAIIAGLLAAGVRHVRTIPATPPSVMFHDDLAANAKGRPVLSDRLDFVQIENYSLEASLPSTPGSAYVFAVDASLAPLPGAVVSAFGITQAPTYDYTGAYYVGALRYFPASGTIWLGGSTYLWPGSVAPISNAASAIALSRQYLVAHGLFSDADLLATKGSARLVPASFSSSYRAEWIVTFERRLGGLPDYGYWQPGATLEILDTGLVMSLVVVRHPISGHEQTQRLISAAQAWNQVALGHWFAADGFINNGPVVVPSFRASDVQLCYREDEANTYQYWLIPMWCFTDSVTTPDLPLRVYYPALPQADFDWIVPNR